MRQRIAELVRDKIVDGIADLHDESTISQGIRIVIELKKEANPNVVLNNFRITSYNVCYTKLLRYVIRGISTKNLIPILNCIKFNLTTDGLYLMSTDNEIAIKTFIPKKDRITSYNVCYTKLLRFIS